jgi:hypothetical protein
MIAIGVLALTFSLASACFLIHIRQILRADRQAILAELSACREEILRANQAVCQPLRIWEPSDNETIDVFQFHHDADGNRT